MPPKRPTQWTAIASMIDAAVVSGKMLATESLIASSKRWLIMILRWNRMSHWTIMLKSVASRVVAMDLGVGLDHERHMRQESTMPRTRTNALRGAPANLKTSISLAAGACQKRM